MAYKLSEGALKRILEGERVVDPVVQILAIRSLKSTNPPDRYKFLLSDGLYTTGLAMGNGVVTELAANGDIIPNTILKLKRFAISPCGSAEKRILVVSAVDIVKRGEEVGIRIGNPVNIDSAPSSEPKPVQISKPTASMNQVKMSSNMPPIHPISTLNPYQNKWSIKARVTNKQPVRTYTNAKGEGKLFSVVFTDGSGEIKCTGFNSAVDKFADLLKVNNVYLVSNCSIKPANKKFTQADYEMTFNDDSIVTLCPDDSNLPSNLYNFVPISKISEINAESIIDVIGVAKSASDVQTLTARSTGKELKKREITLVEPSRSSVVLTLWGQQAVEFNPSNSPIVAVKGVRVTEFMGGKSLSFLMSSTLQINPDVPEACEVRGWFDSGGCTEECVSVSAKSGSQSVSGLNWVKIGELASQGIGLGDKADYFSGIVNVLMVKSDNCIYKACPAPDCKKKVMDMNNGQYRCEKCDKDYDHFMYRMLLSVQVSDYTGSTWVTLFHEEAQKLLGASAEIIGSALDNRDESYKEYFTQMNFKKFHMKFRTKMESFNDEKRLKTTVVSVDPVDYKTYARRLIEQFKEKEGMVHKPC